LLLDECVDRRLAAYIKGHSVESVQDVGWRSVKNGELLRLAEGRYDVFVTVDRNLAFQQPVARFDLAIIILRAKSNDADDLKELVPAMLEALPSAPRGRVTWIKGPAMR
jgi:predicted nuclease of predicted toxin-antitoxin system